MRKALAGAVVLLSLIITFALVLASPASAIEQSVDIRDNVFDPATKNINVGDTVRWTNRGTNTHNVTFDAPLGTNLGDTTANTSSVSPAFNTPGTFTYFCRFHTAAGMRGTIVVGGGTATGAPRITSNATTIPAGGSITVTGTGFPANSSIDIAVNNVNLNSATADASGNFPGTIVAVPATAPPGTYPLTAAVRGNPSIAAPPLSLTVTAAGTTVTTTQAGTVVTTTPTTLATGSALPSSLPATAVPPGASSAVVSGGTARTGANDRMFLNAAAVALALGTLLVMITPRPGRHARKAFGRLR